MINKDIIEKLRHLPIEQVADSLGMGLRWHNALCPFHDDRHPSLHFSAAHNTYHCYVCGAHGGTIDLVMHQQNLNFHDACCWLAEAFGIYVDEQPSHRRDPVERRNVQPPVAASGRQAFVDTEYLSIYVAHPVLSAEAQHFLFDERKLDRRVVEWCHISSVTQPTPCSRFGRPFYDAPSLLIPYYDGQGILQSVQSRYLGEDVMGKKSKDKEADVKESDGKEAEGKESKEKKAGGKPRFKFPKGSQCHIYNLNILRWLQPDEELFITEGCTDCWAMMSVGRKAIAIPSATLLKPEDIAPLKGLNLHIFPDQDEPGERLYLELKDLLPQLQRHQLPAGVKDFSDYYLQLCK